MKLRKSLLCSTVTIPILTLIGYGASISLTTNPACAQPSWEGQPFFIEGGGVSNCGAARIDVDAKNACINKARDTGVSYKSYRWYNADREDWQEWNGSRKCKYRATVVCVFSPPN